MPNVKQNFDDIIRRYQEEARAWTRSWIESNLHKPAPVWDENGNLTSAQGEYFDMYQPKEAMIEFAQEIAHDYIIPLIQEHRAKAGSKEEWEDLLLPTEDSAQDYIFPILMNTFRDEAYKYLEKMQSVLREIDRDLLGYPHSGFAANRILSAIVEEIEDELAEDQFKAEAAPPRPTPRPKKARTRRAGTAKTRNKG